MGIWQYPLNIVCAHWLKLTMRHQVRRTKQTNQHEHCDSNANNYQTDKNELKKSQNVTSFQFPEHSTVAMPLPTSPRESPKSLRCLRKSHFVRPPIVTVDTNPNSCKFLMQLPLFISRQIGLFEVVSCRSSVNCCLLTRCPRENWIHKCAVGGGRQETRDHESRCEVVWNFACSSLQWPNCDAIIQEKKGWFPQVYNRTAECNFTIYDDVLKYHLVVQVTIIQVFTTDFLNVAMPIMWWSRSLTQEFRKTSWWKWIISYQTSDVVKAWAQEPFQVRIAKAWMAHDICFGHRMSHWT